MTEPAPKNSRAILGQAFLTAFLDLVGFSIIFPLFPEMLRHYLGREGADSLLGTLVAFLSSVAGQREGAEQMVNALFGGILGALYSLAQFVFSPIWGSVSDRIGRRPTLVFTLIGTTLAHFGWVFAGSFWVLLAARLIGGIMAGNVSTVTAVVADVTEKEDRTKSMGIIGAAIGLGFIIGPAVGGIAFAFNPLDHWPALEAYGVNRFSGPAIAAFTLSLLNAVIVIAKFPETHPKGKRSEASAGRTSNPIALFKGVSAPGTARVNFIYFVFQTAFSAMEFSLVFLTVDRFHYGPMNNAMMFVFVGFIIAFVQGGVLRPLSKRMSESRLAMLGMAAVTVGMVGVAFASAPTWLFAALFVLAGGSALVMPSLSSLASKYAPPAQQGLALGLFRSSGSLSRAVGPLLGGTVYWQFGSASPTLMSAVLLILPLVLAAGLPDPN